MKKLSTVAGIALCTMLLASTMWGQLSGTFYIGATPGTKPGGGDPEYATWGAAIAALNSSGVNGPCVFYFLDATINESANLSLGCTGTNSTNTITFKPYTGVTTTINLQDGVTSANIDGHFVIGSATATNAALVPTTYVTIDGSNNGTSSKDLVINGPVTANQRSVIRIFGDNDNITIKNTIIVNNCSNASTNAAINITNYNTASTNFNPDNLTIQNNTITSTSGTVSAGVHSANSGTPTVGMNNFVLRDNIIAANLRGAFVSYTNNADIYGNTITVASTGATTNLTAYGITTQTNFATAGVFNIYKNKLTSLTTNCTISGASNGITGIDNENTSTHVVNIYDNFIGGFGLTGTPNNARIYGIRVTSTSTSNIYHNTIYIPELTDMATSNNIAGIAMATAAASEASPSAAAVVTIKNNIIKIDETTMKVWGIRRVGATGTFTSNYNDVYINATNTSGYYGLFNATDYQTLANWQGGSSQDANSKSVNVTFTSSSDLHLTGGSDGDLNLIGVTGLGVASDIDGDVRSGSFPYMGADEAATALPVELSRFTVSSHANSVELVWNTSSELNNYGFEIERKTSNNWSKVGFVEGKGTTNAPQSYSFKENVATAGKYAYRLKQIDRDGKFSYSKEVETVLGLAPDEYSLGQNYPNPFNPSSTIRFALKTAGHATLKVYNSVGQEVKTLFDELAEADKSYSVLFDGTGLASGTYFYVLQTPASREVKKMLMLK